MFKKSSLTGILLLFFILTIFSLFIVGNYYHSSSVLIAFLFLLSFGCLLLRGVSRKLFFLSFFINILVSIIFHFYFLRANGLPFTQGGDEKTYYDFSLSIYHHGITSLGEIYLFIPYKAYVLLLAGWMKLLNFIGITDPSIPFNLRLLNDFVGGFIPVISFHIFSLFFDKIKARKYSLYILLFPLTIYYSATLLREVYVTVPFLLIVYLTLSPQFNRAIRIFLIGGLCVFTFFIRPASAAMIVSFPFFYVFFKKGSNYKFSYLKKSIIPLLFLASLLIFHQFNSRSINETHSGYSELSASAASGNSVGSLLVSSHNPIAKLAMPVYIAYSPIPPPIFSEVNIYNTFISIGSIWWYVIFPLYILLIIKILKRKDVFSGFIKASGVTVLFSLALVSVTSMDPRHIQFIYPIALFGGLFYYKNYYFSGFKKVIPAYVLTFTILLSSYLLVKGL